MTGENDEPITMEAPHIYVERTLAIIKPDSTYKAEEIEDIILRSGFAVLQVTFSFSGAYASYSKFGIVVKSLLEMV